MIGGRANSACPRFLYPNKKKDSLEPFFNLLINYEKKLYYLNSFIRQDILNRTLIDYCRNLLDIVQ